MTQLIRSAATNGHVLCIIDIFWKQSTFDRLLNCRACGVYWWARCWRPCGVQQCANAIIRYTRSGSAIFFLISPSPPMRLEPIKSAKITILHISNTSWMASHWRVQLQADIERHGRDERRQIERVCDVEKVARTMHHILFLFFSFFASSVNWHVKSTESIDNNNKKKTLFINTFRANNETQSLTLNPAISFFFCVCARCYQRDLAWSGNDAMLFAQSLNRDECNAQTMYGNPTIQSNILGSGCCRCRDQTAHCPKSSTQLA